MDEYKSLLVLAYFKENYKTYDIYELMKLMGMSYKEINEYIHCLIKKGYMSFISDFFILTKAGEKHLTSMNMNGFCFGQSKKKRKKRMDINQIYVPQNFQIM